MKVFPKPRMGLASDRNGAKPTLRDCIEAVLAQADALMDGVITGLCGAQGQSKERAARSHWNTANAQAIDHLSRHAQAVRETFVSELRGALYNSAPREREVRPILRFDDFQFLDEDQIDANIEYALAQQEVDQSVEGALAPLNALISSLLGLVTVQASLNPLKPEVFVYALRESLARHVKDEGVRVAMATAAASLMGLALRQLYKDLAEWLRSLGIEPALPLGALTNANGTANGKTGDNSVSRTLLTLDRLKRLLSGDFEIGFGLGNGGAHDFLHTVPTSFQALEDMEMVEPMMQRLAKQSRKAKAAAKKGERPITKIDMLVSERSQNKHLGRELGGEVVRLMLENLMNDAKLLPRVRAMLKELEPVLLQLSQSDPRFFSDRQHPARQLLDRLTSRSLAFSSDADDGFARFAKSISNSIQVLVNGSGDTDSFARVLRKLEEGWQREEDVQRKNHEEAARALLHAEQRNLLAQRYMEDFQKRLKDKEVPERVVAFLRGPWAQVMAESQLSCTDGTSDPQGYLQLVDDLIWSVQVRLAKRNRARLVQLVPNMLAKVRQGLQLIEYPEDQVPALFDELITLHEQAFDGSRAAQRAARDEEAVKTSLGETPEPEELLAENFWVGEQEANESGYLAGDDDLVSELPLDINTPAPPAPGPWAVSDLNIGSWVELMLEGKWVRAQLTWASPHLTLFMFVSGKGLAHSMSRRTMDRRRAQDLIRVVSDGDVIGSALDAVTQTALRNNPERAIEQPTKAVDPSA